MKKFVSMMGLLASSLVSAGQQVTVTGTGSNPSEAKRDALHQASMRYCPSAVVNDREYRNYELNRNDLSVYNGCIVKNYTVVDEQNNGYPYSVTISAEVIPSRLPKRILSQHPEWFYFDVNQHNDRLGQIKERFENGKKLIDEVFYDFNKSALVLDHSPYKISYQNGHGYINVSYKISWNKNYFNALEEMVEILADGTDEKLKTFLVQAFPGFVNPNNNANYEIRVMSGSSYRKFIFNDEILYKHIRNYLLSENNSPVVILRVRDDRGTEYTNVCIRPAWYNFSSTGEFNKILLNPNAKDEGPIQLELPDNLPADVKFTMEIAPSSFCTWRNN